MKHNLHDIFADASLSDLLELRDVLETGKFSKNSLTEKLYDIIDDMITVEEIFLEHDDLNYPIDKDNLS